MDENDSLTIGLPRNRAQPRYCLTMAAEPNGLKKDKPHPQKDCPVRVTESAQKSLRGSTARQFLGRFRSLWRRHPRRIQLFPAVLVALFAGVAVAVLAWFLIGWLIGVKPGRIAAADLLRLALYIAAGVGGFVALVVAYRKQDDLEQGRFIERFGAAAAQLGDTDPAVRLAGAYAMAGVADEAKGLKRQQCIDVLCSYLRLPYSPGLGASNQSGFTRIVSGGKGTELHENFSYRINDHVVRRTIVRIITSHLRISAVQSWSRNDFDFSGAALDEAAFNQVTFSGDSTSFNEATFSGERTSFDEATFSGGNTSFEGATFSANETAFDRATFSGAWTLFERATFSGTWAIFQGATFASAHTSFAGATFNGGRTFFEEAIFRSAWTSFDRATFSSDWTSFDGAVLSGSRTSFEKATFSGAKISFREATFSGAIISFKQPRSWTPSPIFDWDANPSEKPANVLPADWPPEVVEQQPRG